MRPRKGDAVLWLTCKAGSLDAEIDPSSQHAGLPLVHGEKWILNFFFEQWALPRDAGGRRVQLPSDFGPVVPGVHAGGDDQAQRRSGRWQDHYYFAPFATTNPQEVSSLGVAADDGYEYDDE